MIRPTATVPSILLSSMMMFTFAFVAVLLCSGGPSLTMAAALSQASDVLRIDDAAPAVATTQSITKIRKVTPAATSDTSSGQRRARTAAKTEASTTSQGVLTSERSNDVTVAITLASTTAETILSPQPKAQRLRQRRAVGDTKAGRDTARLLQTTGTADKEETESTSIWDRKVAGSKLKNWAYVAICLLAMSAIFFNMLTCLSLCFPCCFKIHGRSHPRDTAPSAPPGKKAVDVYKTLKSTPSANVTVDNHSFQNSNPNNSNSITDSDDGHNTDTIRSAESSDAPAAGTTTAAAPAALTTVPKTATR